MFVLTKKYFSILKNITIAFNAYYAELIEIFLQLLLVGFCTNSEC